MCPTQVPQLSSSRSLDMNDPFTLENPRGTTRKRSLLIGINYVGQNPGALKGFAERGAKTERGRAPTRQLGS